MMPDVLARAPKMLKASKPNRDPDLPNIQEALSGPYREQFLEAMAKEIKELEDHGTWEVVERSTLPEGVNVLPSTWAFRVKRYPDGRFLKTKARFCAQGNKQVVVAAR